MTIILNDSILYHAGRWCRREKKGWFIMKEYLVRYIPVDKYCTEKTIFVFAENRLDAINKTLEMDQVKKFILVKL